MVLSLHRLAHSFTHYAFFIITSVNKTSNDLKVIFDLINILP